MGFSVQRTEIGGWVYAKLLGLGADGRGWRDCAGWMRRGGSSRRPFRRGFRRADTVHLYDGASTQIDNDRIEPVSRRRLLRSHSLTEY